MITNEEILELTVPFSEYAEKAREVTFEVVGRVFMVLSADQTFLY